MSEFNQKLVELRLAANLSQREVARRIGVPESTYREWEYGNAIQGEPYPKISKAFGVTLDELFDVVPEESIEANLNKIISLVNSVKSKLP